MSLFSDREVNKVLLYCIVFIYLNKLFRIRFNIYLVVPFKTSYIIKTLFIFGIYKSTYIIEKCVIIL